MCWLPSLDVVDWTTRTPTSVKHRRDSRGRLHISRVSNGNLQQTHVTLVCEKRLGNRLANVKQLSAGSNATHTFTRCQHWCSKQSLWPDGWRPTEISLIYHCTGMKQPTTTVTLTCTKRLSGWAKLKAYIYFAVCQLVNHDVTQPNGQRRTNDPTKGNIAGREGFSWGENKMRHRLH